MIGCCIKKFFHLTIIVPRHIERPSIYLIIQGTYRRGHSHLEVLKEPAKEFNLYEEEESLLGRLPTPRPISERHAEALKSTVRWTIFSSETHAEEIESLDG